MNAAEMEVRTVKVLALLDELKLGGICYFWPAAADDDDGHRPLLLTGGTEVCNALGLIGALAKMLPDPEAAFAVVLEHLRGDHEHKNEGDEE